MVIFNTILVIYDPNNKLKVKVNKLITTVGATRNNFKIKEKKNTRVHIRVQ